MVETSLVSLVWYAGGRCCIHRQEPGAGSLLMVRVVWFSESTVKWSLDGRRLSNLPSSSGNLLSSFADSSDHPSIAWGFFQPRMHVSPAGLREHPYVSAIWWFFSWWWSFFWVEKSSKLNGSPSVQEQRFDRLENDIGSAYESQRWSFGSFGSFEHRLFQRSIAPGCNCNRLWLKTGWGTAVWFMHWKVVVVVVKVVRVILWWWKGDVFNIF